MRDAVTSLIENYDVAGRYLDRDGIDRLKSYFATGTARVQAAAAINSNAAAIVKQAGIQLFAEQPELIRPRGKCLHDSSLRGLSAGYGLLLALCYLRPGGWKYRRAGRARAARFAGNLQFSKRSHWPDGDGDWHYEGDG